MHGGHAIRQVIPLSECLLFVPDGADAAGEQGIDLGRACRSLWLARSDATLRLVGRDRLLRRTLPITSAGINRGAASPQSDARSSAARFPGSCNANPVSARPDGWRSSADRLRGRLPGRASPRGRRCRRFRGCSYGPRLGSNTACRASCPSPAGLRCLVIIPASPPKGSIRE